MANAFREMSAKSKSGDFASYSARPSRKNGASTPSGDGISALVPKDIKDFWNKMKKDYMDSRVAERMKDSHEQFIKGIEKISTDLSKDGMKLSGSIADAYKEIVSSNKGNKKLHGVVAESLHSYSAKVAKMDSLISESSVKRRKGMADDFRKLNKEITELAAKLGKAGIAVKSITASRNPGKTSYSADDKSVNVSDYSKGVSAASKGILNIHQNFEKDLESSFESEIAGRAAVVAALFKFAFDIGGKFADVAQSRLQNVLNDTDFTTALRTGLSPDEMNAWNNANRNTLRLLGKNADTFAIDSQNAMHSFGLVGKAAQDATTQLNKISFEAGIGPSVANNTALQDIASKLQALQGISQSDAVQQLAETSKSMNYYLAAAGKTAPEQLKILNNQAFELTRIARSSGYSAQYMQGLYEEAKNKRFGSVIDQIKTAVTIPAYLDQLESLTGDKLSGSERSAFASVATGAVSTEDTSNPIVQTFLKAQTRLGPEISGALLSSAKNLATGNFGAANIGPRAIIDALNPSGAASVKELAEQGSKSSVMSATMGAATQDAAFYADQLQVSKDSLNKIEEFRMNFNEYVGGIGANPLGSAVSGIASTVGNLGLGALALRGTGLLPKLGGLASGGRTALGLGAEGLGLASAGGLATTGVGALAGAGAYGATALTGGVAAAGIGGYALGTIISDKLIAGTSLGDDIGNAMAHTLAFFGNDEAQAAIDMTNKQNMVAGRQIDENGNVMQTSEEQTEAAKRTAELLEKQNKMMQDEQDERRAKENKDEARVQLEKQTAEQSRSQQIAGLSWTSGANTAFGNTINAINRMSPD